MADPSPSEPPIEPEPADWLASTRALLLELQVKGQTMTYLEFADQLGLPGPQRIHQLTELLEATMAEDAAADRIPRAARVISRTRSGLPAPGFFAHAKALGIMGPESERVVYTQWRALLDQERQS